jgi:hypothetical protein
MSARRSAVETLRVSAQSPPPPNAVIPEVTVQVRVHWPAGMGHTPLIERLIADATRSVIDKIHATEAALADSRTMDDAGLRSSMEERVRPKDQVGGSSPSGGTTGATTRMSVVDETIPTSTAEGRV